MIPGVHCSTCLYFSPAPFASRGRELNGQCRRHAPVLHVDERGPKSMWPLTTERMWRGEHSTVGGDD